MTATVQSYLYPVLKGLAFGSFAIHFAAQVQVLQSSLRPTLLFPRTYSPNDYYVTVFCALSASLNVMWLKELFVGRDDSDRNAIASFIGKKEECVLQNVHNDDEELGLPHVQECQESVMVKSTYLPFYIVGNILFYLSSFSAAEGRYDLSHLFALSNSAVHLFLLYILAGDAHGSVITPANFLTHLVMKTNIGLNILFMWRAGSVLNKMENPSIDQLVAISAAFILATISSGPDPTLGLSILFVLFSLIFSDEIPSMNSASVNAWQSTFSLVATAITACLAIEFIMSMRHNFPWLSGWKASSNRNTAA